MSGIVLSVGNGGVVFVVDEENREGSFAFVCLYNFLSLCECTHSNTVS